MAFGEIRGIDSTVHYDRKFADKISTYRARWFGEEKSDV